MRNASFDTLIIGSGPGGEGAAMRLAKAGQRVAVVEAAAQVGGGCIHRGTVPSKSLRQSIQMLANYRANPLFQHTLDQVEVDYPMLLARAQGIIQDQVNLRYRYYRRNGVEIIHGRARFLDPHRIQVLPSGRALGPSDTTTTLDPRVQVDGNRHPHSPAGGVYTARTVVIATGSRPYHPPEVDFTHARVLDSDKVLELDHTPRSLTIYGAGVIGCEYASIFCNLDVKVNLVDTRQRLLSFLDREITDALGYHLRNQGTVIRHNEQFARVETLDDGVVLHCQSGKRFKSDYLLWANGRSGNTDGLGLESVGIEADHRGQVPVDERYRTQQAHIFAVGDAIGRPGLASASYDQGRFVGNLIACGESDWRLVKEFPLGIYTSPEISALGRTEQELTEAQVPYEVAQAQFRSIARAQISGQTVGMLKILFHPQTLEILGIHCFGDQAAEIVHIGQAIMAQQGRANSLEYFAETTFNYPTMAEAYRVAALNGLNRLF